MSNKAYAVKFLQRRNGKEKTDLLLEYIDELLNTTYDSNSSVIEYPKEYHYYSNIELKPDDIVLVRSDLSTTVSVCRVVKEVTENVRATRNIIAKVDFGSIFEEQKKQARKTRLLDILDKEVHKQLAKEAIIDSAKHLAQSNENIAAQLEEYLQA